METPTFHLDGVVKNKDALDSFDGPLSLILMLLSRNKIAIRDIQISEIFDQYTEYLSRMQFFDLDVASEFAQMASQLLYLKTRMLLNSEEAPSELEMLIQSLEAEKCKEVYSTVLKVIPSLRAASENGLNYYVKEHEILQSSGDKYQYHHEPVEMLSALLRCVERGGATVSPEEIIRTAPQRIVYSIKDKCRSIISRARAGSFGMKKLFGECGTKNEAVACFLSLLELCSLGAVKIEAVDDDYEISFTGSDVDSILDNIFEE